MTADTKAFPVPGDAPPQPPFCAPYAPPDEAIAAGLFDRASRPAAAEGRIDAYAGNLIAGISLLLYRPFNVGDRLQITAPTGLETGLVESLGLGYTVLKTDDNRRVVVPNSVMASQTMVNLTGEAPRVLCSVPIGISCDSDIDKARAILLELARQHPLAKQVTGCPVTQVGPVGVILTVSAWCPDPGAAAQLKCDLLEQVHRRFAKDGIELPFPQTVVTLKRET